MAASFWRGKRVWITGASSGIGEALAVNLHEQGAVLLLSARRETELQRVRDRCQSLSPQSTVPAILTLDQSDIASLPTKATNAKVLLGGHIEVLINNGGRSMRADALDTTFEVERDLMNVNYFSAVTLSKCVLPEMIEHKEGFIVVVSSVQGRVALPERSSYSASKHALTGYFNSLRMEVKQHGVCVTLALPGYVATNLSLAAATGDGSAYGVMDTATARGYPPEMVADRIVRAVERRKREVWIMQLQGRLAIYLQTTFPTLLEWYLTRSRSQK